MEKINNSCKLLFLTNNILQELVKSQKVRNITRNFVKNKKKLIIFLTSRIREDKS